MSFNKLEEERLGKYNDPEYIKNLERHFAGFPTIVKLSNEDSTELNELKWNRTNYLFGDVTYKPIVTFVCAQCDKPLSVQDDPRNFRCDNCNVPL